MDLTVRTPIEHIGDLYFKRDDLFKPFNNPVNGGKLRQCLSLLEHNKDNIKNGIITCTSVLSPQAVITAACAQYYNTNCIIYYGGTTEAKLMEHQYPKLAHELGAKIEIVANTGRTSVLQKHVNDYCKNHDVFMIEYGMDLKNNIECFFTSTAYQCINIPDNITDIWVSCGSAITICGILYGLAFYPNNVQQIHAVGIAPNRMDKIKEYCALITSQTGQKIDLNKLHYIDAYNELPGYKYENIKKIKYCGLELHPRYEAKAFEYLQKYGQINNGTLFWIIGADLK